MSTVDVGGGEAVDWTQRAVCRDADPEEFFPVGRLTAQRTFEQARHAAQAYCARCPVLRECHQRAERTRSQGVWAGAWRPYGTSPQPLIAAAYDLRRPRLSRAG
jgi:WhiB family redox-sensing transcriptional regulator